MHWSGEEYVLAVTGVLFLAIVVASISRRFSMSAGSRASFLAGAVVFTGSAVLLSTIEAVRYPPPVWVLPLVPAVIIGVLVRDAIAWQPAATAAPERSARGADADVPSRAAFFPPAEVPHPDGEGGRGEVRRAALDPDAPPQMLADIAFTHPQLRADVATNPATPANILEWLASQDDPAIVAALAKRPSPGTRPSTVTR